MSQSKELKPKTPTFLVDFAQSSIYGQVRTYLESHLPPLPEYDWNPDKLEEYKRVSAVRQGYRLAMQKLGYEPLIGDKDA